MRETIEKWLGLPKGYGALEIAMAIFTIALTLSATAIIVAGTVYVVLRVLS